MFYPLASQVSMYIVHGWYNAVGSKSLLSPAVFKGDCAEKIGSSKYWGVFTVERNFLTAFYSQRGGTSWRHDMEMFSALHTLCGGNPSMTSQRARKDGVGVLFLVRVKKLVNKQSNNRIAGDVLALTWMVSLKPYGVKHGWMPKGQLCKVLITKMLFSPCSLR